MSVIHLAPRDTAIQASFRDSMRHLVGGVSVITVGRGEERTGLTVTSLTALSVEPPRVIFCINASASSHPVLRRCGVFGVNLLGRRYAAVADRFAGRGGLKGADRYQGGEWIELRTGAPILADASVALDCEVEEILERHSHTIVIGKVVELRVGDGSDALCYWRRGFHSVSGAPL